MAMLGETAKTAAQNAVYDAIKAIAVFGFGLLSQPWLKHKAESMNAPGASLWAFVMVIIVATIGLWLFDWWRATRSIPVRRVRLLDYHCAHLMWVRRILLEPGTSHQQIADAPRVIDKHRRQLLDMIPTVFPTSAQQEFGVPGLFVLSPPVVAQVSQMNDSELRAQVMADLDSLLNGIYAQWLANDGVNAPKP